MRNTNAPPLRSIQLTSRPHNQHALAWSSDAELAVAADDSVAIYLPYFPALDPNKPLDFNDEDDESEAAAPSTRQANGMEILPANLANLPNNDDDDDDLGDDGEEDGDMDGMNGEGANGAGGTLNLGQAGQQKPKDRTPQFGEETSRVLWVSHPPHPELNLHVWEAAGKAMPLIRSAAAAVGVEVVADDDESMVDAQDVGEEQVKIDRRRKTSPETIQYSGAGTGAIGGSGSSLNHVVAVEWSPGGLGRNLRPVLAVLTGCGRLAMYGEGGPLPFGSTARSSRVLGREKRAVRDLQSWLALWAVGENFVLPGQEEVGYGEFVKAFAWSREMGMGQALMAYMNDLREIVVLCVGTTFRLTEGGLEEAIWNVQEITRLETGGPHAPVHPDDPDYVPSGSSYCLRWGPWAKDNDGWSSLLSYTDRNYVGFKKIAINAPTWNPIEAPVLTCEPMDWNGMCVHLATDAFLEFEDMIWDVNGRLICRGVIATPLLAVPFEATLNEPASPKNPHSTNACNTTFPSEPICNPITGLIIHPVPTDTAAAPPTPLYTAVRLSATATNPLWWESNAPLPPPHWVNDIEAQISRILPLGQAIHEGNPSAETEEDGEDGVVRKKEADETAGNEEPEDEDDESQGDEEDDNDADFDPWANEGPDVYPYRMRLWGLALSPGGGSSAVLTTPHLTQRPMRDGWSAHRSRVVFGYEKLSQPTHMDQHNDLSSTLVKVDGLSTEGRMWEWMYGGGPAVPNLTPPLPPPHQPRPQTSPSQQSNDAATTATRERIRALFASFVAVQRCEICGDGGAFAPVKDADETADARVLDVACPRGHRFAVCGVTGLAILEPGVSRACGVCQSRCLDVGFLVERVLVPAGELVDATNLGMEMVREVCARCGGKFLD